MNRFTIIVLFAAFSYSSQARKKTGSVHEDVHTFLYSMRCGYKYLPIDWIFHDTTRISMYSYKYNGSILYMSGWDWGEQTLPYDDDDDDTDRKQEWISLLIGVCDRTNPADNACRNTNGKLVLCLEIDDYGTSFACLCMDTNGTPYATTNADCGS